MQSAPINIILFCGHGSDVPTKIADAIRAQTLGERPRHRVCAIVASLDTGSGPDQDPLYQYAKTLDIPFVRLIKGVLREPLFVAEIFRRFQPDWAVSIFCTEIFPAELIDRFDQIINFHNGSLPAYKGVRASAWAIANGEAAAGWCVHRLTAGIDEGPILMQGKIAIGERDTPLELDARMASDFALRAAELLEMLDNNERGTPQQGRAHYYSYQDAQRARLLGDPENYSARKLLNHIRAFAPVLIRLPLGNTQIRAARLMETNQSPNGDPTLAEHQVTSSDGKLLKLIE